MQRTAHAAKATFKKMQRKAHAAKFSAGARENGAKFCATIMLLPVVFCGILRKTSRSFYGRVAENFFKIRS